MTVDYRRFIESRDTFFAEFRALRDEAMELLEKTQNTPIQPDEIVSRTTLGNLESTRTNIARRFYALDGQLSDMVFSVVTAKNVTDGTNTVVLDLGWRTILTSQLNQLEKQRDVCHSVLRDCRAVIDSKNNTADLRGSMLIAGLSLLVAVIALVK